MPKKKPMDGKPEVHKDLKGFEININEFGEIKSNFKVDKLNKFLDQNVDDKKLVDQSGLNLKADAGKKSKGDKGKEEQGKSPIGR